MTPDERANLLALARSDDLAVRLQAVAVVEAMGWPPKPYYPGWRVLSEAVWLRVDGAAVGRRGSPRSTLVVLYGKNGHRVELKVRHPSLVGAVDHLESVERLRVGGKLP